MQLFGFEIKRAEEESKNIQSFVEKTDDDGAITVSAAGAGQFGQALLDLEGQAKTEAELVTKYRNMEQHPEVQKAVDDIVNEAIIISDNEDVIEVNLDGTELSDAIKKRVSEEFKNVLELLDFSNKGYDIFNRWYIDGRINYHVIIDNSAPKKGIMELRSIDPRKLRKVREIGKKKDAQTDTILKQTKNEYYVYNEKGFLKKSGAPTIDDGSVKGVKIAKDSIIQVTSGILNETNSMVLSHLHKAIKPLNQLKMLEDAAVIYRISRAPERRIFYIDVGNLPKAKAEQYLRDMMTKHKNRLVYDGATGEVKDDRKHMTMMEDFWLPRREGGKGTEITTLPGGQNLGEMEDVLYFQKNLYKSLNVPISRMESDTGFSLGRASEISRDEVKFSKFIRRLRARFSILFDEILEKQLVLKGVMTPEEFKSIKNRIRYDFMEDNHYEELKNTEILRERLQTLRDLDEYVGKYYSQEWVRKNVLMQSDEDIEELDKQMEEEGVDDEDEDDNVDMEPRNEPAPNNDSAQDENE